MKSAESQVRPPSENTDKTGTIEIVVNGSTRSVPAQLPLHELLVHLEVDPSRVAVERNREIVRKPHWASTEIVAGDQLEIVWFVGGGVDEFRAGCAKPALA